MTDHRSNESVRGWRGCLKVVLRGRAAYFNMKAAPMHVKVEQTFGMLKSRFPALRSLGQRLRSRRDQTQAHVFIVAAVVFYISFSMTTSSEWTLRTFSRLQPTLRGVRRPCNRCPA